MSSSFRVKTLNTKKKKNETCSLYKAEVTLTSNLTDPSQQLDKSGLGRVSWPCLHVVAKLYPIYPTPEDKRVAGCFMEGFVNLYPCLECRPHAIETYKSINTDRAFEGREAFSDFIYLFHNQVTMERSSKPLVTLSFKHGSTRYNSVNNVADLERRVKRGKVPERGDNLAEIDMDPDFVSRCVWIVLHSFADCYPCQPLNHEKRNMRCLLEGILRFYVDSTSWMWPARHIEDVKFPSKTWDEILKDRQALVSALCDYHNEFNVRLGKPVFVNACLETNVTKQEH